ncbi:polysaccharide deacetylase family protein [Haloplanus pelagicus]|uniref:polysaccharide deacetylase family protein n=1 Tax=Haloplanus pelagicus TaxID=2949995 RepID=UPI0031F32CC4
MCWGVHLSSERTVVGVVDRPAGGGPENHMEPTVVISVEIELAWGLSHLPGREGIDRHSRGRTAETATLERLLSLCDDLSLPLTFDVVGHLLLERCAGRHDGPHDDVFFGADPGTDAERDPLYYAPDLIRRILDADTPHEIGSHTFSHTPAHEVGTDVLDWELDAARRHHADFGLSAPTSFVPPIHAPVPHDLLRTHGFDAVRTPTEYWAPVAEPDPPASLLRALPWRLRHAYPVEVLFRSHPVREPTVVDGVVEHYSSWHASLTAPYLPNGRTVPHRAFRLLPRSLRQSIHERYLRSGVERAVAQRSCAHFWSHLFNLSNDAQWEPVESALRTIARRRDRGDVAVRTMDSLTERIADA